MQTLRILKMMTSSFAVRPAIPLEAGFIIDTWHLLSISKDSAFNRMSYDDFKIFMRERIMRLLSACSTSVLVHDNLVMGFCCYSVDRDSLWPILHFLYEAPETRRNGRYQELLNAAGVRFNKPDVWVTSEVTLAALRQSKFCKPHYNPFLLEYDPAAVRRWL